MLSLSQLPVENRTILVRVDYNVPRKNGKILDLTKLKTSLPTIKYILKKNAKIVLMTHLGRPDGKKIDSLKLNKVANELRKLLPKNKIVKLNNCIGSEVKRRIEKQKIGEIILLENLRFYKEEKENDAVFAHSLANLADFYVNDAFAVSHRAHASISAITKFIPAAAGLLLETEILNLNKALHPKKPSVWLMGGAKLKKVDVIENALKKSDVILIGGALAFQFLRAKGIKVGNSLVDKNSIEMAKKILKNKNAKKIVFPLDFKCAKSLSFNAKSFIRQFNEIKPGEIGLDLGPKTIDLYKLHLSKARTVVWNGPLGYFEVSKYQKSTKELTKKIISRKVFSVCGGGETLEVIRRLKLGSKFTHLSTGGGATLAYLAGKKMPGIIALQENKISLLKQAKENMKELKKKK